MSAKNIDEKYIAALDIGTTSVRCFVYNSNVQICGVASEKVWNHWHTSIFANKQTKLIDVCFVFPSFRLNYCIHNLGIVKLIRTPYGQPFYRPFKRQSAMQNWRQTIYRVWAYHHNAVHLSHGIAKQVKLFTILLRGKIWEPTQWSANGIPVLH